MTSWEEREISEADLRPAHHLELTLYMVVLNTTSFAFMDFEAQPGASWFYVFTMAIGYFVLWFFWQGRNWARLLGLAASVVALFDLLALFFLPLLQQLLVAIEAILAVYLFYWLNRAPIKAFFRRPSAPAA